jgi:tetratricopeptide (TPR) repeat protein
MAESLNDAPARVAALEGMAWALWGPGHTDHLSRVARELVDIAEPSGDAAQAFFGHLWTLVAQARRGEVDAVDQEIEELTARADRLRSPSFAWWGPALHAMRALMDGRFEEAERLGGEALGIGQNFEAQWTLGQFGALLFGIRLFQGRMGELEEAVRAQMAQNPDLINWPLALAHLLAEEGRVDEARAVFDTLAERDFADIPRNPAWQLTFWQLTEICALLGDARRARIVYDRAPSDDSEVIFLGPGIVCAGATARSLGLLATTMSRWDDAERHFEAAIDLESRMDAPPYLARTQFEYARMLLMRGTPGDRERATELLEQATIVARELGMRSIIERSEPLLAEIAHA